MNDVPVVQVHDIQERLTRRFGSSVVGWCAELPALADAVARRWGLRLGSALPAGGNSVVLLTQVIPGVRQRLSSKTAEQVSRIP